MSLDIEKERENFVSWHRAKFGYSPLEAELYGHTFDVWLAAKRAATHPSPIPAQAQAVPTLIQACEEGEWVNIHAHSVETYIEEGHRVRKLYEHDAPIPAQTSACPTCPKDTPYGPAFCGKCMEAREAAYEVEVSAADGLTDEQIENVLETARECIVEGHGYKYNESDLRAAIRSLVASYIKAGGQVESGKDAARYRALVEAAHAHITGKPMTPQQVAVRRAILHLGDKTGIDDLGNALDTVIAVKEGKP